MLNNSYESKLNFQPICFHRCISSQARKKLSDVIRSCKKYIAWPMKWSIYEQKKTLTVLSLAKESYQHEKKRHALTGLKTVSVEAENISQRIFTSIWNERFYLYFRSWRFSTSLSESTFHAHSSFIVLTEIDRCRFSQT